MRSPTPRRRLSRSARLGAFVLGSLLALSAPAAANSLSLADLAGGAGFVTANELEFSNFVIGTNGLDLSSIHVDVLSDGFALSGVFEEPAYDFLEVRYTVTNVGAPALHGEPLPGNNFLSLGIAGIDSDAAFFSDTGSLFFPSEEITEAGVAVKGAFPGVLDDGDRHLTFEFHTSKKVGRKGETAPVSVDNYIDFSGLGELGVENRFSVERPVPEPGAALVFLAGLAVIAGRVRRS